MRRVVWFAVGAGVGVFALVKARQYLRKSTPQAIGGKMADSAASLSDSIRDFSDNVRAAMAERETEIRDAVGLPPDQR